jgi:acylphosphatase
MKHVRIKIFGRVQRIGFRFSAMQAAYKYGICGIVQNGDDGSVWIEAEGDEECVNKFIEWCKVGPLGARVEKLLLEDGEPKNYTSFDIQHI